MRNFWQKDLDQLNEIFLEAITSVLSLSYLWADTLESQ